MLVFLLTQLSSVNAANYSITFDFHEDQPPNTAGIDYVREGVHTTIQHPDVSPIASSHPDFWCELKDNVFFMYFESDTNTWPSSFPTSVTCSYGPDTLTATVNLLPGTPHSYTQRTIDSSMSLLLEKRSGYQVIRTYFLPSNTYEVGFYSATLSDTICKVSKVNLPSGGVGHAVQVFSDETAGVGIGTCNISLTGGSSVPLSINVTLL